MIPYVVQPGDCFSSIAKRHGFSWRLLWDLPENAGLRARRGSPNIIHPGDVVHIPDREQKRDPGVTEKQHTFCKEGTPTKLLLRLRVNDDPRQNQPYQLIVGDVSVKGTTSGGKLLEHSIPADATEGKLILGSPPNQEEVLLRLGHLDPVEKISGVQARLTNLGFGCGEVDGVMGPMTENALRDFQEWFGIPVTGKADDTTRAKLVELHGS